MAMNRTMLRGAALVPLALATQAQGEATRPNILFIMSDDHAAHAIGAYGSRVNATPQIDRLANEGVLFRNGFCNNSICAPSRAAILTGLYSHRNGVTRWQRFDGSQTTFPKLLQASGYHTALVGKWHLGSDPTGFDFWSVLPGQGAYHDPEFIENGVKVKKTGYATGLITDMAIEQIESRPKDKPFCLLVHHKAPHRNWQPDAKHAKLYEGVDIPEPDTLRDDYATRSPAAAAAEMRVDGHMIPGYDFKNTEPAGLEGDARLKWRYQEYIKDYLRCIASVDDNVGRLLDYLDAEGLAGNTIVVYTSDQGFFLGDHGWYDKRFMYEESLRMPMLLRWPAVVKPGAKIDALAMNLDFAPLFLEAAGVPVPSQMQGRSLMPLLRGETPPDWRTATYYRYYDHPGEHNVNLHYGLRTARYKLIFFHVLQVWELYDLERDPRELDNVYGDPAYAEITADLKRQLAELRKSVGDAEAPF